MKQSDYKVEIDENHSSDKLETGIILHQIVTKEISRIKENTENFTRLDENESVDKPKIIFNNSENFNKFLELNKKSKKKHIIHVLCFITYIVIVQIITIGMKLWRDGQFKNETTDPAKTYGIALTILFYFFRCLIFLPLPLSIFHACGLIVYNVFSVQETPLREDLRMLPFICIRVVTRGDYPELVRCNLERNMKTCLNLGLDNFRIEIVTDKELNLENNEKIREVVVPSTYVSKTNCKYKSRALQYALEDNVNLLRDEDWIVHLDEETLLTESSLIGIVKFILDNKHQIGQGLITYANISINNWLTTLADSFRVGSDLGMLRFCMKKFQKPLFIFKGSFVVSKAGVERAVSFDNGAKGSIAEDTYFAMSAMSKGYSFGWIEGEMWEQSPFSIKDFLQQRKRWMQGIFLVVHDTKLPIKSRFCLAIALYTWLTLPLSTVNIFLAGFFSVPGGFVFDILSSFIGAVNLYLYLIGAVKSFTKFGYLKRFLVIIGSICTIPFVLIIENIAIIWGIFSNKHKFYIVEKFKPNQSNLV